MKYKKVNLVYPKKLFKKKEVLSEKNGFNYPKKWTLKENKKDFKLIFNKKLFLFIFSLIFLIGLINFTSTVTETTLGTFKQWERVRVSQVCSDATYINLSSITYPNSNTAVSNIEMNSVGSGEYFYDFNDTTLLGRYDVRGISDGCDKTFATYFNITPSGDYGVENIVFIVLVILLVYAITFIGFFTRNTWITVISSGAMVFLGVWMMRYGIIIYSNDLTTYLAVITWGLGAILGLWALVEYIIEVFD